MTVFASDPSQTITAIKPNTGIDKTVIIVEGMQIKWRSGVIMRSGGGTALFLGWYSLMLTKARNVSKLIMIYHNI